MHHRIAAKLHLPLAVLVFLLQRTPSLPSALLARLSLPSIQIVQKAFIAVTALAAPHALSGASSSQYRVDQKSYTVGTSSILHKTDAKVGESFKISISNTITAASWSIEGNIPPGLVATDVFHEAQLVNGIINVAFLDIVGTPTTSGPYSLILKPWSLKDGKGTTAPKELNLVFDIAPGDPSPATPPTLRHQSTQSTLTIHWTTSDATGYQLTRSTDLSTWTPVDQTPNQTAEESSIQIPLTQTEFYRFEPNP